MKAVCGLITPVVYEKPVYNLLLVFMVCSYDYMYIEVDCYL